jgi:ParB/RepB/Spo0J family partition protein
MAEPNHLTSASVPVRCGDPGSERLPEVHMVPVGLVRPEDGLGRQRDRSGHDDLCASIEQFGVLTPITVRKAPDGSGEFLLVKGQGRTLACRLLGLDTIPAIIVDEAWAENEKVQQFLVENVARLRMRAVDRAILIANARQSGEETSEVARRFGVTAATVRRLEAQLDGVSEGEVEALQSGRVSLSLHAVVSKHGRVGERGMMLDVATAMGVGARDLDALLRALGWSALAELGDSARDSCERLLAWACGRLASLPKGPIKERIAALAIELPVAMAAELAPEECA